MSPSQYNERIAARNQDGDGDRTLGMDLSPADSVRSRVRDSCFFLVQLPPAPRLPTALDHATLSHVAPCTQCPLSLAPGMPVLMWASPPALAPSLSLSLCPELTSSGFFGNRACQG